MKDLYEKAEKAIYTKGPAFLNVLAPCPRGWRYEATDCMIVNKLAIDTCFWPLYEVINGKYIINYKPKNKLPVVEFLKVQGRFRHLFKKENEDLLVKIQEEVDKRWEELLLQEELTSKREIDN
jgi:pyruvate ferredoxin oxidoreductase beta subunit